MRKKIALLVGVNAVVAIVAVSLCLLLAHQESTSGKPQPTYPIEHNYSSYNHTPWDDLLKLYVRPDELNGISLNVVNYAAIRRDARFPLYLDMLSKWPLANLTADGLLALYMNAYNAHVVKLVVDNPCKLRFGKYCYPLKSIRDIGYTGGQIWRQKVVNISGKMLSLDETRKELQEMQDDPNIHASLACASVSCPDLRTEAFVAERVHEQMNNQMVQLLANPTKGFRLDEFHKTIHVSQIFNWYKQDFDEYMHQYFNGTLMDFIILHVPKEYQHFLLNHQFDLKTEHISYDWRLNNALAVSTLF